MQNTIQIQKATIKDAEEILSVQKAAYELEAIHYNDHSIEPLTETLVEIKEKFKTNTFLKAVIGGKIVGSVRAYEKEGTCYIGRLAVLPEMHNKGIGKAIIKGIEGCFDPVRYELYTAVNTLKNVALYEKLEYVGYKKEFRGCGKIEVVYMEKIKKRQDE